MQRRTLGKTGESLSIVGFGGILVKGQTDAVAGRLVAEAIERGINYFDVAPMYGDAQARLGPALQPYRKSAFLACKTLERSKAGARAELEESLRLLRTDHFDLYQFHAVHDLDEIDQITGPDGALETFVAARQAGLVRFIGCSAHSEEAGIALLERFPLDSVLFPINYVCWHQGQFGQRLLAKALQKGAGVLALKSLARRALADGEPRAGPEGWYASVETPAEAALALRFTLSRPVTAAIPPGNPERWRWACDAAEGLKPLSDEEEKDLRQRSAGLPPLFPL